MCIASICGLGQVASNPIATVLKHYPEEVEKYVGSNSRPLPVVTPAAQATPATKMKDLLSKAAVTAAAATNAAEARAALRTIAESLDHEPKFAPISAAFRKTADDTNDEKVQKSCREYAVKFREWAART